MPAETKSTARECTADTNPMDRCLCSDCLGEEAAARRDDERYPIEHHYNRLPCGCPLDSGCTGWHS